MEGTGRKPSKVIVQLSDRSELIEAQFDTLMERYVSAKERSEEGEATKKEVGVQIHALLIAIGVDGVEHCGYVAVRCNGKSGGKLNTQKLIERGVDPELIEECWEGGASYTYVQVMKKGEEGI